MRFHRSTLVASLCVTLTGSVSAFVAPTPAFTKASSSSALFISSWGTKGPPRGEILENLDPWEKVQAYLPEPAAVEARNNIDGTCLVSGLIHPDALTPNDQFIFDLLNHQDSAFEFDTIVAFVVDSKLAKKRLLSRSARYTGLLDKLEFVQAPEGEKDALPKVEDLIGIKTWLAYVEGGNVLEKVKEIAKTAEKADTVENLAILIAGANELDVAACQETLDAIKAVQAARDGSGKPKLTYSLVAVGKLEDHPEGRTAYMYEPFGTEAGFLPAKAIFSRQESYRMITELLQLESGANKALCFAEVYNVNATNYRLVKGLREAGYARCQEVDHMIREGPAAYEKACDEWRNRNPDAAKGYTTNAWWEAEIYQKSRRRSDERLKAQEQNVLDERAIQVEKIAKEWVKREYFRQSMAGTVENDMTEEEFSKTVWERALLEGDMKHRLALGEVVDEEAELLDFKKRQELKQKTMLKKAKRELAELLGEDVPVDDDDKKKKD